MITLLLHVLRLLPVLGGGQCQLALENLALRHQLAVYKRTVARPRLRRMDRLFWVWLARVWAGWRPPLVIVTAQLRVLFVLVVLAHHRRRVLHFNVTEHPTAAWTAQQIVDTFPDETAPANLLRDRDTIFGESLRRRVKGMRIQEVLTAARSPWQNPFAERLIGSIRRECLDHVLVLSQSHLRHILTGYFAYYHGTRTHLSLTKDAPDGRLVEPPELGGVVPIREVGGLHHRYVRRAA